MEIGSVHKETGAFWDEIADTYSHGKRDEAGVIAFLRGGGSYLAESERRILGDLKPWCKRAIHLQCSGGLDALSLLREGAAEVIGVDISERLLASARRKSEALGAAARWVRSDVLQTPADLNGAADLVYTGKGALCWMMDLDAWAGVVSRLLAPGGRLFVLEGHPLNWVWDTKASAYELDPVHGDYFSDEVREGLFDRETAAVPRSRQWTLAQVVNSVIGAGLVLERLEEYPDSFWDEFPEIPEKLLRRLPHTFSLLARKR